MISFNLFEPVGHETDPKPAVIIGHGIMANKEFIKGYAIELAAAGFAAIALDFRGHGQSTGELNSNLLVNDVHAIIDFLNTKPPTAIDMNKLAYIGYSMGGPSGNAIVNSTYNFKCFVGVGTIFDINTRLGNSTDPLNVLMIQARFDEVFDLPTLIANIAPRTGKSASEVNVDKLYGNFENGNAAMIYLDDNSEHLLVAWDQDFIRVARDWVINTFYDTNTIDENFYANYRFFILIIQLVGGLGLFFLVIEPLSNLILKTKNKEELKTYKVEFRNTSTKNLAVKALLYSLSIVLPLLGMGIMTPLLLTPLNVVALVIIIFFGQAFAFLFLLWRAAKKDDISLKTILKLPFKDQKTNLMRQVALGAILSTILYVILYLSISLNYFGMIPSLIKLPWILLFYGFFFIIALLIGIVIIAINIDNLEDTLKNKTKVTFITFGYLAVYTVLYVVLFSVVINFYFFLLFLIIILPILLLTAAIIVATFTKTGNLITGTIISAVLDTLISLTLSPLTFNLFMILLSV